MVTRGHKVCARESQQPHRAAPAAPYSGVEPQASSLQRTHRRGTARERKIARDGIGENTDATALHCVGQPGANGVTTRALTQVGLHH